MTRTSARRNQMVEIARIRHNPDNIRTVITGLESLAASIRKVGIQNHLVGHQKYDRARGVQDIELIHGHRRLAAAEIAGLTRVPMEVRPFMEPDEILLSMIAEGTEREAPDLAGIRGAIRKLRARHKMDDLRIAEELGTSVAQVRAWLTGDGRVPELQPGPVELPETPYTGPLPDLRATFAAPGAEAATGGAVAVKQRRPRNGALQIPKVSVRRLYQILAEHDAGQLTAEEVVGRLRGAVGGWRP